MVAAAKPMVIMKNKNDATPFPFDIAGYQIYQYQMVDGRITIFDAACSYPLDEFIDRFISVTLMADEVFRKAGDYLYD